MKIMRTKNTNIKFLIVIFITLGILFSCGKSKDTSEKKEEKKDKTEDTKREETKKGKAKLYFCEDYKSGEIGVSDVFTPGWLTVMVDLRPAGQKLGVGKVELRISKVKDASGEEISEKIIDTVPFDVQADWDYTYFQDKDRISFKTPGVYRVTMQKVDGTPICSGEVKVVPRGK